MHGIGAESIGPSFETCTILRQKTKAPQELKVPEVLRPLLRAWWERANRPVSGPVFPVQKGKRAGDFDRTRGVSYAKRFKREPRQGWRTSSAPGELRF